ncbi:hypothetical protein BGZ49_006561 [Haplosporangium sp. Z 27]|nr:hypothetical protein BGZ49_006561 [Haplosporangium sp. Z 27]
MDNSETAPHAHNEEIPTILQDDLPLEGSMTTTLSFETGISPSSVNSTMMDSNPPNSLTETLTSFSSNASSYLSSSNNTLNSDNALSTSRRSSTQLSKPVAVRETLNASVTENADGALQLGQYILKGEIGKGAFGKVHLAEDADTHEKYAIKEFSKSKLRKKDKANLFKLGPRGRGRGRRDPEAKVAADNDSPLDLIRGEIAILKKLHHNNIVKLYEVLDANDDSMYMVFEYCEKGVLMPVSLTETFESKFSDDECRDIFQQMILGIEYLHEHDIIHRDIKPDNLLRSGDNVVKIVDFGVSEMFNKKGDDLTKKSAGSPAFMAPELCRADHGEVSGRATDVWSMGVTLYCLRYGHLPYVSASILEMQQIIRESEFKLPEGEDPRFVHLIKSLLEKDPSKRITIDQLREDPWVTNDGKHQLISKEANTTNVVTELTDADIAGAIKKINPFTVVKAIFKFKRGIKHHPSPSLDAPANILSEAEKVADAEEGNTNIAQTSSESTKEVKKSDDNLEGSMNKVSLEEASAKEEEPVVVQVTQEIPKPESESVESAPVQETTPISKPEDKDEEEEPQGYQVCDMESGMCYWVPAKKNKTPPASGETQMSKVPKATVEASETPDIHVDATPAQPTPAASETTTTEVHSTPATHESVRTSAPVQESHLDHERSSSGSSSPGQLLNAGPRLVGKLSRERFAMFEKKE